MPRSFADLLFVVAKALLFTGAIVSGLDACAPRPGPAPASVRPPGAATFHYPPREVEPLLEALPQLDQIAAHAWSDMAIRILIVGGANDGADLSDNLRLAAERAEALRGELLARAVPGFSIVVAANELAPSGAGGGRCEVHVLASPTGAASPTDLATGRTWWSRTARALGDLVAEMRY